jgi:hypothetical protein
MARRIFMAKKTLSLKDASLTAAGSTTPPPASKYTIDHGRTSKMPAVAATPKDNGGLSDGTTGGNFNATPMGKVTINATPTGTQSGSEAAQAAFESNSQ